MPATTPLKVMVLHDRYTAYRDIIEARHPDLETAYCDSYAGAAAMLADFAPDVLFGIRFPSPDPYPREAILATPSLNWISVGGSGTDHMLPWDPAAVTLTNAAGVASDMMAQYALGAILAFSLGFPAFERHRRARRWVAGEVQSVVGKTVVIVGLGKTGQDVARRCKSAGLRTLGVRANPKPTDDVDRVLPPTQLHQALAEADFVVIAVPLLASTRAMIDQAAIDCLRSCAVLIDVSRGGVVDGQALIAALESGRIAGAALDVFETEPLPEDSPFWALENVIVTPHCSSIYDGWDRRAAEMFCDNLARWRAGEPLANVVDPERGY